MISLSGFLVDLHREEKAPLTESMVVAVSAILWPFAQRLWRQLRGGAELPNDLRPLIRLHPRRSGPLQEPPPPIGHPADSAWSLEPVATPRYPLVEVTLSTHDEVLSHGFYRLDDVFSGPLCSLADMLASEGELRCSPGRYFYDVYAVPLRTRSLWEDSRGFSQDSFELPLIADQDPHLHFEQLDDQPLAPAVRARPIFTVPGSCRSGETRATVTAWEQLALSLTASLDREIGGYLVGTVGEDQNGGETVTIQRAVPAEFAAGDAHVFILSPESGAEIRRRIEQEWPDQELVGWYHSHVFSAKNEVLSGLSDIDEKTHGEQFTRSWQIAALINVWRDGGTVLRQVRIYRRNDDGRLVDVDYSVVYDGGSKS
ncbi:MAG: hypothetical protein GY856_01300 [bacterium]|nr:hypothetical protein [bacterium]